VGQEKPRDEQGFTTSQAWKDTWKWNFAEHQRLLQLHLGLREEIMERWCRALPFNDELFDRWERAAFLGFGKGASIYDSSLVLGDVQVGEQTWIGPYTILDGSGGLSIGSWCSISAGVQLYTHDSVAWALTRGQANYAQAPTSIGDCCYLGPLTIVEKGVTIGSHCVIGANSLVNRDIPDFSIAVGTPCRLVGQVRISETNEVEFVWTNSPSSA
jgi:acetyltransferase-like isoleucine patch superfamily enzyme